MIARAVLLALGQLGDPRFRGVLLIGLGLTVALFVGVYLLLVTGIGWLVGDSLTLPWIGTITWVDNVLGWAALPLMLGLSVVLMVPVASAFTSVFLDRVADAVEARHYPSLPAASPVPLAEALKDSAVFLGVIVLANLAALVLYLAFAPLAPLIFWGLNGFLLGREYVTLAAMRRVGRDGARRLRRRHAGRSWAAGVVMALPLSVPVVNLLVPILGAATFTHLYHMLTAQGLAAESASPARPR